MHNLFCHLWICHLFNSFLNHYLTYKESYNYDYHFYYYYYWSSTSLKQLLIPFITHLYPKGKLTACLFCQAIDVPLSWVSRLLCKDVVTVVKCVYPQGNARESRMLERSETLALRWSVEPVTEMKRKPEKKGSTWCNEQHFFRADWNQCWTDCSQTLSWICPTGFNNPVFLLNLPDSTAEKRVCVCVCVTGGWGWHTNVYLSRPPFVHPAPVCRRSFSSRPFFQRLRCHGLK